MAASSARLLLSRMKMRMFGPSISAPLKFMPMCRANPTSDRLPSAMCKIVCGGAALSMLCSSLYQKSTRNILMSVSNVAIGGKTTWLA